MTLRNVGSISDPKAEEDINAKDKFGNTPLHWAVLENNAIEVQRLIDAGADINIKAKHCVTPLSVAAERSGRNYSRSKTTTAGYLTILEILIKHHPNPADFPRALECAVKMDSVKGAALLLAAMQNKPAIEEWDSYLVPTAKIYYPWYIDLMYEATIHKNAVKMLTLLKQHGADFNFQKEYSEHTLLSFVITHLPCFSGLAANLREVEFVISGAENSMSYHLDKAQSELLESHKAFFSEILDTLDYLLANGANPALGGASNGTTPLHVLIKLKNLQHLENAYENIIDRLLQHGADVNARDPEQNTPMHLAAIANKVTVVNHLLLHKGDVNAQNKQLETPLHLAVRYLSLDTAGLLIKSGANMALKNQEGLTASELLANVREHVSKFKFSSNELRAKELQKCDDMLSILKKVSMVAASQLAGGNLFMPAESAKKLDHLPRFEY